MGDPLKRDVNAVLEDVIMVMFPLTGPEASSLKLTDLDLFEIDYGYQKGKRVYQKKSQGLAKCLSI